MFSRVQDFMRRLHVYEIDHDLGGGALLNSQKCEQVVVVDFVDQSIDFNIIHQVLTASAAGKVHKIRAMFFTFIAQFVEDSFNINFV